MARGAHLERHRLEAALNPWRKCERKHPDSDALCRYVRRQGGDTVLLGFSGGKDSIGAWLQLRRHGFKVHAFYLYYVPGIRFVEENLRVYEQHFGQRIHRFPDPSLFRTIEHLLFQSPANCHILEEAVFRRDLQVSDYLRFLRKKYGAPHCLLGDGTRASDSLRRALNIKTHGVIYPSTEKFYPIFDWKEDRLEEEIRAEGLPLPIDYRFMYRTWECGRFDQLSATRDNFPDDWRQVLRWQPLAELELMRRRFYVQENLEGRLTR